MAEFTYYQRLEPRARSHDFTGSFANELRDPLWFLTRQWQVGEFRGEDAGSVAFVDYAASTAKLPRWLDGASEHAVDQGAPLERQALSEPFEGDLGTAVELGHDFADLLRSAVGDEAATEQLLAAFRNLPQFQVNELPDDNPVNPLDASSRRFLMVCAGRVVNGVALYELGRGIAAGSASVPTDVTTDPARIAQIEDALAQLVARVGQVFGGVSTTEDPLTWQPKRLEYQLQVVGVNPSGDGVSVLNAHPDSDGEFEWFSFDVDSRGSVASDEPPEFFTDAMVPNRVEFDGMPATRFWNFEENRLRVPAITAEQDDIVKLLTVDFVLQHSHDWYTLPFPQEVGTLARIEHLVVHDVFGKLTVVRRADQQGDNATAGLRRWTMFSTTDDSATADGIADYFILPPSSGPAMQLGAVLEDVRFGRDEMANMAWGIERITLSPIGEPRSGRERNADVDARRQEPPTPPADDGFPLRYQIESEVPVNWIPLLPVQPAPPNPSIALRRGRVLKDLDPDAPPQPVPPLSAILTPASQGSNYQIFEEEIPRSGLRVQRVVYRARWVDGSTHLWVQRRRKAGAGESQSGLQFDQALPKGG
jgi:hypothetical protein